MTVDPPQSTPATNGSDPGVFTDVRDFAVNAARSVAMIDLAVIQQALDEGERALAVGTILDPMLWMKGADELGKQLRVIRALQNFRLAIEGLRPDAGERPA